MAKQKTRPAKQADLNREFADLRTTECSLKLRSWG
jgi:hypothetical protein